MFFVLLCSLRRQVPRSAFMAESQSISRSEVSVMGKNEKD